MIILYLGYDWNWQLGDHQVELVVDPDNLLAEFSEQNNALADRTNGVVVGFWVEQSVYDYFQQNQRSLGIGSNSWECLCSRARDAAYRRR